MSQTKINIILFGNGNVGSALVDQIIEKHGFFLDKKNIDLQFTIIANSKKALLNKNGLSKLEIDSFDKTSRNYNFQEILDFVKNNELENPIAIDATASEEFVKNYIPLIQSGFHVVAANKKANTLSQDFYQELRFNLDKFNRNFLYETNVGAALPVIKTIQDLYFSGDTITKIRGVFSGTLSYIFNRFSDETTTFSEILVDAEKLGLTEPDSREDLSGNDVGRKLLILARELEQELEFSDVNISSLLLPNLNENNTLEEYEKNKKQFDKPFEIAKITQLGTHVLRYIGEIDFKTKKLEVKLVSEPRNSPIGQLKGADNIFEIYTITYGEIPIVIQGAGAGKNVTARGVLNDILQLSEKIKIQELVWV
jgi:homoserine dehydrogenase